MKLNDVKISLKLPYIGEIQGTWEFDEKERQAAWEMYVEIITRISVWELKANESLLREALSSLHSLFGTTRSILRQYGPTVAQPKGKDKLSFGYLAVTVLNSLLRPFLAKWHSALLDYEKHQPAGISQLGHESQWEKAAELRDELNKVRLTMMEYANILSKVAGVPWEFGPREKL